MDVLRKSPLQCLPVPDLFKRLDQWHQLKRQSNETIPQFLVREEDVFVQLQESLQRAHNDRCPDPAAQVQGSSDAQRGPPSTPSQSPIGRSAPRPTAADDPSAGHATSAGIV